ncbi:MalY/PatB family protein [Oscillibacter sp.]|jgi:cystathionine beta-lyase|uniref:MalY/PatB family protein n=1 Tax=Oscillibacter sp. TaxID=1945593 RepID=UPI00216FC578|nr:MalY/PatB family protein [Oscillibacter sp.]MCI9648222.1 pyridoxal phosphate-dependent aminotransferase [Oscillibacter sp.]
MKYDFDTLLERKGTSSFKWDTGMDYFGRDDVIPMWVADMDFACAPCVVEAVQKRAAHPIYGYTVRQQSYYDSVMGWLKRRYGFSVSQEYLCFSPPGVIYAINIVVRILTEPGDTVLIPTPNYDSLFDLVTRNGRILAESPMRWENGRYVLDYEDLERKAERAKALIFSSPHNPTGRVWTREELERLTEICMRHDVFMLFDEIHCDFILKENPHTTIGLLGEEVLRHSMVCYSASKGFNLGGLGMATIVLADDDLRQRFKEELSIAQTRLDNVFGAAALMAAYTPEGEAWLDQAIAYVSENKRYLADFLKAHIPQIQLCQAEGTYLVWLDCSGLPYRGMALEHFMINEARVVLSGGYEFGSLGDSFLRMNLACPRSVLREALERMEEAVRKISV